MNKYNLIYTLIFISAALLLSGCAGMYAKMVVKDSDKNGDKLLTYEEYFSGLPEDDHYVREARGYGKTVEEYSLELFKEMDTNQDGFVSIKELKMFNK